MTYVCTEKATIKEWLEEIERLKAENNELRSNVIEDMKYIDELETRIKHLQKELNFYKPNYK